jgi:UDP-N-acetylglucosamine 2-epimerase (non-hydrolysing)
MKVMTVLGTRPEIIRLSGIIALLDSRAEHILVHTGQNFDDKLNGVFFRELGVRQPDVNLGVRAETFGEQAGQILAGTERLFMSHRPDRILILGDTNSGLAAIAARRLGIPVYHMEAGNRCYDDRVPEEINRRIIDHSSSVLIPYTEQSRRNLLREGISSDRIFVSGNPIKEVIDRFRDQIDSRKALEDYELTAQAYFLVTMHRAENVDREDRLRRLVKALTQLYRHYSMPVVCSLHPRTRSKIERFGLSGALEGIRFVDPLGFLDFIKLESSAFCLISDSGTVQEEACILAVPNVTIRDVTERPETVECGSNYLAGSDVENILRGVATVTAQPPRWVAPPEYLLPAVSETVARLVLAHRTPDAAELEWQEGARL